MAEATPWPALMSAARQLGVSPSEFWRLSLREWRALAAPADQALSRAGFEALARLYPDKRQ